jgi:hypothetical protein
MSVPSRTLLAIGTILVTGLVVVQMELGEAHWKACFERMLDRSFGQGESSYQPVDTWGIALNALWHPSNDALMLVAAPMLPALAAIALARPPWMAFLALAPMLLVLWLALDPSTMHDCDRKGCNGCLAIVIFMLMFQLPISTVVSIGLGLHRLWPLLYRRSIPS